jgi:hypothetical protein
LGQDWSTVVFCDDVNTAWYTFKSIFVSTLNTLAPVKTVLIKQRSEEWVDSEVLQCIKARDKAFQKFKRDRSDENFNQFKLHRNKANYTITNAKRNFFKCSLVRNQNDSKSLWKSLKDLGLPGKTKQSSSNIGLNIGDSICFDKLKVAEEFNSFYTTIADKLVSKLPNVLNLFGYNFVMDYYRSKGVRPNSFQFSIVSESRLLKYINTLCPKKATGLDGIPSRFIKDSGPIIAGPLAHIINLSVIQGIVPDDLKSARVIPLHKKNDKTDVGNYRPVSILCVISKILERVIYDQLEVYLSKNNILYEYQSGFRPGFSTDTCLIHLTDYIRFQMDKGHFVGMVLLDLQKAFDTVNHSILLMKLKCIGLSDPSIRWFTSYLSERRQLVEVSGTMSSAASITCGVPQGSILGPLLFLIYVNDMSAVVKSKLLLYADDSAILVSGKNKQDIEKILSDELNAVSQWLICNKLSLHLGKTESILFGSKPRLRKSSDVNITCNDQPILPKSSVKYLGVTLDQNLSFECLARSIIRKSNARLKFLYRKSKFLNYHTRKLLVNSLIQCHFDYASSAWFNSLTQELKQKLQVTQNKIIRFVLNLQSRSHIGSEHFLKLKWLPVQSRVNQIILCHVFRINSNTSPIYLRDMFIPVSSIHRYPTRFRSYADPSSETTLRSMNDSLRFMIPKVKGFGKKSFAYSGCCLWNNLPQYVRNVDTISAFKNKVKEHLLDIY